MTRNQTIEAIRVMQAWVDGEKIQARNKSQPEWFNISKEPRWDWHYWDYRIEPIKKLRPWTADEVPLGAWMRNEKDLAKRWVLTSTGSANERSISFLNFQHSTDFGKTWLPCGVEEGGSL